MKHHDQDTTEPIQASPRRKWAAMATVPAAAVMALAFWPQSGPTPDTTPTAESTPSTARSERRETPPAATTLAYHWKTGNLLTYEIDSEAVFRIEHPGEEIQDIRGGMHFAGRCSYRVLSVEPDRVVLTAQVSSANVVSNHQRQAVLEELFNAEPVILVTDHQGRRLETRVNPALPTEDRGMLAGVHDQHIVLPEDPHVTEWTTTETTPISSFECRYTRRSNGSIEKSRRPLAAADGTDAGYDIAHSDITATIGTTWLDLLIARESFASPISGGGRATMESRFQMRRVDDLVEPEAMARLATDPSLAGTFTPLTVPGIKGDSALRRQQSQSLEEKYAAVPLSEMIRQLRESVASARSHADTVDAMHALEDWLEVHPDEAFALVATLTDPKLSNAFTARAIHALELSAQNPQSQQALAEILRRSDEFPPLVTLQAAIAAGGIGAGLRPELHHALSETANRASSVSDFTLSDAALYALGSLGETNPHVAAQLGEALLPDLDPSNHARTTQSALHALANARIGSPEFVGQATQLAHNHATPEVRAAAIQYLSRLPETQPEALIPYLQDPSERVQLETIDSLARRQAAHPEVIPPLEELLATSSSELVADRLRKVLGE